MALSPNINNKEQDKFVEDPNGDTAVRVVITQQVPNPPVIISITSVNEKNTITWSSISGATNYVIYWDTSSGVDSGDNQIDTASTSTTYEHTGLTNGVTYYYRVVATGAWGNTALGGEDSGTPISYTNNYSVLFDGVDEYVTFGNNHNYENNDAWSFSCWLKPTNPLAGSNKCIWAKATNDVSVNGWGFYTQTTGKLLIQVRASGQNHNWTSNSSPFAAGTWVHLVVTYAGGQNISGLNAYFDSVKDTNAQSGVVTNTLLHTDPSQLARRNTNFPNNTNIDEVTFWGVELSQSEVTELYNLGSPDDPTNHSQAANLEHWYKMGDSDTFPTISDNQGSVDGTMINMESGDFEADVP